MQVRTVAGLVSIWEVVAVVIVVDISVRARGPVGAPVQEVCTTMREYLCMHAPVCIGGTQGVSSIVARTYVPVRRLRQYARSTDSPVSLV